MLNENIKQLRKEHRLTQMELAKKLGISTSAIGMYEQGRREPDIKILTQMAEIFGVSTDILLGVYSKDNHKPKDVNALITDMRNYLLRQKGVMFDGVALRDEEIEKIVDALRVGIIIAIEKSKNNN